MLHVPLQLAACKEPQSQGEKRRNGAYSMRDTYANSVEGCPLTPCHLTERVLGKGPAASQGRITHLA